MILIQRQEDYSYRDKSALGVTGNITDFPANNNNSNSFKFKQQIKK